MVLSHGLYSVCIVSLQAFLLRNGISQACLSCICGGELECCRRVAASSCCSIFVCGKSLKCSSWVEDVRSRSPWRRQFTIWYQRVLFLSAIIVFECPSSALAIICEGSQGADLWIFSFESCFQRFKVIKVSKII